MRILVTGSSGFVGSHLVRRLLADGHDIVGLDIAEPPAAAEGWRDVRGDIRDEQLVDSLVAEVHPDAVVHLAAQVSVSRSMREPMEDIDTNVRGTVVLARAAAARGVGRFVNTSSGGAMFGEPDTVPVDDDSLVQPRSIYGASKVAAERYLAILESETGMSVASVRPANIYGPGQDPHGEAGVVAIFTRRMLRGEEVPVFAPGTDTRDYVYVADVVDAFVRAMEAPESAMCLVGTGVETSTLDIFNELAALTGYGRDPVMAPPRAGDIRRIALDSRRAREVWGWSPRTTLREGLAHTVDAFRQEMHGDAAGPPR